MEGSAIIQLKDPDALALEDAYRTLPKTGEIGIECEASNLSSILSTLELIGFAGMSVRLSGKSQDRTYMVAFKGKQGPCYNTGRLARYLGGALAAMDDDHHLLLAEEEMPVCEKTATLYSLPSYRKFIGCSDAEEALLQKLQSEPEPFDCDIFEASLERLNKLTWEIEDPGEYTDLFYPGPFKVLVLTDGTVIRRGRVNKVPVSLAKKVTRSDGLFKMERLTSGAYESFPDRYRSEGPMCLLNRPREGPVSETIRTVDYSSLSEIPGELRIRLLHTMEQQKDYFILTGSNREDKYGCCPSDEVTMADALVRAGILCSTGEPASPDACPVTIYAFRNEMEWVEGNLQFRQDHAFRQEILSRLSKNHRKWLKKILTWILLAFIGVTIGLALTRFIGSSANSNKIRLYEQLDVSRPDGTAVVLFHYNRRCEQCLALERYTREVLKDEFPASIAMKQLQFREVIMDLPENRKLVEELGLVTSTVVLLRFRGMGVDSTVVLDRSWELYDREAEFKQILSNKLHQMVGDVR